MTSKRILCTGGAGFIGSALVHRFNQLGHTEITIVDRLGKTDKWRNLVGLQYSSYMDVDQFDPVLEAFGRAPTKKRWDVIIHLGACSSTRELDARYLMSNNYQATIALSNYARMTETRFVYASSAATYGNQSLDDSREPKDCRPLNAYGLSKNVADMILYPEMDRADTVGLKYTNVWGVGCEHKGDLISFVTKVYREIKAHGYLTMFDTYKDVPEGQDARDFIYVKDAVEATIHFALGAGTKATGLYNVGAGVATTWRDMALHTIEAMDLNPDFPMDRIRYQPLPESLKGKYQYYTCANISKLRASGYDRPMTDVKAAIHEYVTKYLTPDKRIGEIGS